MHKVKIIRETQAGRVRYLVELRWPWSMFEDSNDVYYDSLDEARAVRDEREKHRARRRREVVKG